MLKRNEGTLDRIARLALAAVLLPAGLLGLGALQGSPLGLLAVGVGLIGLITGVTGFCPTYVPLGISTVATEQASTVEEQAVAGTRH